MVKLVHLQEKNLLQLLWTENKPVATFIFLFLLFLLFLFLLGQSGFRPSATKPSFFSMYLHATLACSYLHIMKHFFLRPCRNHRAGFGWHWPRVKPEDHTNIHIKIQSWSSFMNSKKSVGISETEPEEGWGRDLGAGFGYQRPILIFNTVISIE